MHDQLNFCSTKLEIQNKYYSRLLKKVDRPEEFSSSGIFTTKAEKFGLTLLQRLGFCHSTSSAIVKQTVTNLFRTMTATAATAYRNERFQEQNSSSCVHLRFSIFLSSPWKTTRNQQNLRRLGTGNLTASTANFNFKLKAKHTCWVDEKIWRRYSRKAHQSNHKPLKRSWSSYLNRLPRRRRRVSANPRNNAWTIWEWIRFAFESK